MSGVLGMLVRTGVRRRRWAVVAVALLTAAGGTTALTALAAARRTSSSVTRALDDAAAADVSVDVNVVDAARLARVRALPEVADVSVYLFTALRPAGTDMTAGLESTGVSPIDGKAFHAMDRPRFRAGRAPRPDALDEVAVNDNLAARLHLHPGSRMTVEAYRQNQVEAIFGDQGPVTPAGVKIDATVTGIVEPLDALAARGSSHEGFGVIVTTPAQWRAYGTKPLDFTGDTPPEGDMAAFRALLRARLVHGDRDAGRYLRDVFRIYGDAADTTFSEARPELFRTAGDSVRVQSIALLLFGLAAALAGMVAAGQAASRDAALAAATDDAQLRAMGLSRRNRLATAALPPVIGTLVGVALAVAGATVASRWMPRGLAGVFEPHKGVAFDATVLLPGAALLALPGAARALASAWRATRSAAADDAATAAARPGRLVGALPAASLGARLALRSGRGRTAIPARATLVAAVVAVAGVVAALTFASSLDHLVTTPRLYGQGWDADVILQSGGEQVAARQQSHLADDGRVAALSRYEFREVAFGTAGKRVPGVGLERLKGDVGPTVLRGRLPNGPDEIAVDPGAVAGPGPRIGATVDVRGEDKAVPMTVVGTLTATGPGSWATTSAGAERLGADVSDVGFILRWRPGTDERRAFAGLTRTFAEVEHPTPPDRVANVRDARGFPYALGAFLAVLGLLAAGHLLITTVRRRRGELAVVRVLGLTPRQTRAVAASQATVVAAVAVVIGVPVGIAAGRWIWGAVANALRVVDETPVPAGAIIIAVVATLAAANLLAALPGRRAARMRPAEVLRTE
ncbi:MAG: putative transport system permease protein [Actinomycetota bacterium]|jgi:hypothetical protein